MCLWWCLSDQTVAKLCSWRRPRVLTERRGRGESHLGGRQSVIDWTLTASHVKLRIDQREHSLGTCGPCHDASGREGNLDGKSVACLGFQSGLK